MTPAERTTALIESIGRLINVCTDDDLTDLEFAQQSQEVIEEMLPLLPAERRATYLAMQDAAVDFEVDILDEDECNQDATTDAATSGDDTSSGH